MIAPAEIRSRVSRAVCESRQTHGYLHPSHTLQLLGENVGHEISLPYDNLRRAIDWHPTRDFLFPGAADTLVALIQHGDAVQIWTNNTLVRVATSGVGKIRHRLPREERWRLGVAFAEDNKISLLPELLKTADDKRMPIVVVDDTPKNLLQAVEVAREIDIHSPMALLLARMQRNQTSHHLLDRPHGIITEIPQLLAFREEIVTACRRNGFAQRVYWLIDFDNTLIDKGAHEQSIEDALSKQVIFSAGNGVIYEAV